ncbi:hypothetical protein F511_29416 [Dorcoceras hygrometricum]|uniref:Uncharacterized protein n=1 Tax=Dorcoceras hygrometricum TaxID=472368 RepID=A0A2Z7BA92_9LAMI|nr:hypothetical protein F511_29416 [Dorcoceras hygrometricum]
MEDVHDKHILLSDHLPPALTADYMHSIKTSEPKAQQFVASKISGHYMDDQLSLGGQLSLWGLRRKNSLGSRRKAAYAQRRKNNLRTGVTRLDGMNNVGNVADFAPERSKLMGRVMGSQIGGCPKSHSPKSSSYAQHIELSFRAGIMNPVLV